MAERYGEKRKLKKRFQMISAISKFLKKYGVYILIGVLLVSLFVGVLDYKEKKEEQRKQQIEYEKSFEAKIDRTKERVGVFFGGIWENIECGWDNVTDFFEGLF